MNMKRGTKSERERETEGFKRREILKVQCVDDNLEQTVGSTTKHVNLYDAADGRSFQPQ